MVASGYRLILLLPATGGPALLYGPFRLVVSYTACVETPLPDVHLSGYPSPDLLGPADAQHLCKNDVGKDKGSLGVPTPIEYPPSFRCQNGRETAPHCS